MKVHVQVEATIASSFNQCTKNLSFPLRVEEEDLACGSRHCVKLSIVIVANVGPKGKRKVRIMEVGACSEKLGLNPMVNNSWINVKFGSMLINGHRCVLIKGSLFGVM